MNAENYKVFTGQDSIPLSSVGTGTITSVNNKYKIVGVATLFTTEVEIGEFIYIKGQNEFSKVESIESDTELTLDRPFTVDLAGSAFDITPRPMYKEVSWVVTGGGDATIDGVTFSTGESGTITKDTNGSHGQNTLCPPFDIDATATEVKVSLNY